MAPARALIVVLFSGLLTSGGAATAFAAPADGACDGNGEAKQGVQYSGTARIPGLGDLAIEHTWDRRTKVTMASGGFVYTRVTTDAGESEITIAGRGEETLTLRVGGASGVVVARGSQAVDATAGPEAREAARALVGGAAVTMFRRRVGEFERRLADERGGPRRNDRLAPHAYGVLLSAAFVGELAGDPNAIDRARDVIRRRMRPAVQAVSFARDQVDCVADYERALLRIDGQLSDCMNSAENHDWFYERAAQRLLCHAEFILRAESALGQFIQCSALKLA